MSGGHFGEYDYYKVYQFADELEEDIRHNGKAGTDGDHSNWYPNHSDEVIEYLKEQLPKMRKMADIMRHIDYLYSGDIDDDGFLLRMKETEAKYQ
jgi:hypothetical protein